MSVWRRGGLSQRGQGGVNFSRFCVDVFHGRTLLKFEQDRASCSYKIVLMFYINQKTTWRVLTRERPCVQNLSAFPLISSAILNASGLITLRVEKASTIIE